jgi:hypothetical protein
MNFAPKTSPTDPEQLREIARGNIERNAEWDENASADTIHDECYTLAFDALHDAGVDNDTARSVAREVAMSYAQP